MKDADRDRCKKFANKIAKRMKDLAKQPSDNVLKGFVVESNREHSKHFHRLLLGKLIQFIEQIEEYQAQNTL